MTEVHIVWQFPDTLGYPAKIEHYSGVRKATSADGRYWLVKRKGLLRRWEWLPRKGMYVRLYEVSPDA